MRNVAEVGPLISLTKKSSRHGLPNLKMPTRTRLLRVNASRVLAAHIHCPELCMPRLSRRTKLTASEALDDTVLFSLEAPPEQSAPGTTKEKGARQSSTMSVFLPTCSAECASRLVQYCTQYTKVSTVDRSLCRLVSRCWRAIQFVSSCGMLRGREGCLAALHSCK